MIFRDVEGRWQCLEIPQKFLPPSSAEIAKWYSLFVSGAVHYHPDYFNLCDYNTPFQLMFDETRRLTTSISSAPRWKGKGWSFFLAQYSSGAVSVIVKTYFLFWPAQLSACSKNADTGIDNFNLTVLINCLSILAISSAVPSDGQWPLGR